MGRKTGKGKKERQCFLLLVILCFFVMSCGGQSAQVRLFGSLPAGINGGAEAEAGKEEAGKEETGKEEAGKEESGVGVQQENAGVITVYATEEPKYSGEEIPVLYTDDLSLLAQMGQADCNYAYRDGMVYYRQYHKDSYEESGLEAEYEPTEGSDKEMVGIDADGNKTVLFQDEGYGNIFLVGDRFYLTEKAFSEEKGYSDDYVYSVDMQGQNRVDYGNGRIKVVDRERNILILDKCSEEKRWGNYFALDCMKNEMTPITFDSFDSLYLRAYQDGWCYFTAYREDGVNEDVYSVAAVSLEGERKKIIALVSDKETERQFGYKEAIRDLKIAGDRLYILFGGYAGREYVFQGGKIITVKLDGSDYRAIDTYTEDYYVFHDAGGPLVYISHTYGEGYETTVWDVEANILCPSNFPRQLIWQLNTEDVITYQPHTVSNPLCRWRWEDEGIHIYALPDDSGKIVRVALQIDDMIAKKGGLEADYVAYEHLYYADGFLYFEVEWNDYDSKASIGWKTGYRRRQTDVYRLELEGGELELLYSY